MVTKAEVKKLIVEEFGVEDMLGNKGVTKLVSGDRWERHINNLAATIWEKLQ